MKRVVIDIDDNYARVLSFTAVGTVEHGERLCVSINALDLSKHTYCEVDENGKVRIKE